jgi:DNA-binding LacI/PurR family transcriptional regulator
MAAGDRPVTMTDIARAAGVSQSTVSRILNSTPVAIPVTDATRARVLALAQEMGYRPHPFARALRGAPTMLLGAVVRDITDVFFAGAIHALSNEARSRGYSLVLGHARAEADEALALAAVLEARQCDAIVLLGDFRDEPVLLRDLEATNIPVVALWHGSGATPGFASVGVDNRTGTRAALEHLVSLGHSRIAFVGGDSLGDLRERQGAYAEFAAEQHLGAPPAYIQRGANTTQWGAEAVARLQALAEPPTALLAATDVLAIGVLHGAFERGVRVPDDLSVIGFDDIPLAAATVPALTTLAMPVAEMVASAVELAVGVGEDVVRTFEPALVVRRSTAPLTHS